MKNTKGQWVQSIPYPYFLRFNRALCQCGNKSKNLERYYEHYAYHHILMGEPMSNQSTTKE